MQTAEKITNTSRELLQGIAENLKEYTVEDLQFLIRHYTRKQDREKVELLKYELTTR